MTTMVGKQIWYLVSLIGSFFFFLKDGSFAFGRVVDGGFLHPNGSNSSSTTTMTLSSSSSSTTTVPLKKTIITTIVDYDTDDNDEGFHLSDKFMSFTVDTGQLHSLEQTGFWTDPLPRYLATQLAPAHFRLGGTTADYLKYKFPNNDDHGAVNTDNSRKIHLRKQQNKLHMDGRSLEEEELQRRQDLSTSRLDAPPSPPIPDIHPSHTMNMSSLTQVLEFAHDVGWDVVVGVNVVSDRDQITNRWNSTHFQQLLHYTTNHKLGIVGWELGNEPSLKCMSENHTIAFSCGHPPSGYHGRQVPLVTPQQLANDYQLFSNIIHEHYNVDTNAIDSQVTTTVQNITTTTTTTIINGDQQQQQQRRQQQSQLQSVQPPMIMGPDVTSTSFDRFGKPFLGNLSATASQKTSLLDVFTWHFYYGSHKDIVTASQFSQPHILDRFLTNAITIQDECLNKHSNIIREIWVGETSSTYGGGTEGLSSSFVAGFMWLDKLGIAANTQQSVVCRQVFAHAKYSVIDYNNRPNPDYWISVLWRRLVGSRVLSIQGGLDLNRIVRSYAFTCRDPLLGKTTIAILNTDSNPRSIEFDTLSGRNHDEEDSLSNNNNNNNNSSKQKTMIVYLLTSSKLESHDIYLNGQFLELTEYNQLPTLAGQVVDSWTLTMPPKSYGFVVLQNQNQNQDESTITTERSQSEPLQQPQTVPY